MQDVCLFAHYDKDDKVDDYVFWYLTNLKRLNFSIVFISTSNLSQEDLGRLNTQCSDVMLRDNAGLDFGSWSAGFAKHRADIDGRLLLVNDSVYGPIGNLPNAFERLTQSGTDYYGMVESNQVCPHLQSWFLLFEPWVIKHSAFGAILAQPFSTMKKEQIIAHGEIGLSRRLRAAGFHYRALHLVGDFGAAASFMPINPTHVLWRELLFEEGIPFLKIEALRDNPVGIEDAETILQAVRTLSPAICPLIRSHLARTIDPDKRRWPLLPSYRRRINAMMRADYRLTREKRGAASAWNAAKLALLMFPMWAVRVFRRALYANEQI